MPDKDALWPAASPPGGRPRASSDTTAIGHRPCSPLWDDGQEARAPVASELRCKRATGVGSLEELTTHEGDLHPWQHEYRPPRPSAPRSTSCSRATASC